MQDSFCLFVVEETSSNSVSVVWRTCVTPPNHSVLIRVRYILTEMKKSGDQVLDKAVYEFPGEGQAGCIVEAALAYRFTPGYTYTIKLLMTDVCCKSYRPGETTFIKRYDARDVTKLYNKAVAYCGTVKYLELHNFYRNKPEEYFEYVKNYRRGVMEVYVKDNNGHRGSPINGRLNGLFFSAKPMPNPRSLYGNTRVYVPAQNLLNQDSNIFFADFYCYNRIHYVTLVVTKKTTEADGFCKKHLYELDKYNNHFMFMVPDEAQGFAHVFVNTSHKIHLEVLYTENVKIYDSKQMPVYNMTTVISGGGSCPGGIARSTWCATCDIDTVVF